MQSSRPETLRAAIAAACSPPGTSLTDGINRIAIADIWNGSCLGRASAELAGKSVLVAVATQLEAALVLIELDGICRRLVLLPPDVNPAHLPSIIRDADVDAIVCSDPAVFASYGLAAGAKHQRTHTGKKP